MSRDGTASMGAITYSNFTAANQRRHKYQRRSAYAIWDANVRDGSLRPFACPTEICASASNGSIYALRECHECVTYPTDEAPVAGFCGEQHFVVDAGRLHVASSASICAGGYDCLAGAPIVQNARVETECSTDDCAIVGVSYVVTSYVEHSGIVTESGPSNATHVVAAKAGGYAARVEWDAPEAGFCLSGFRIYRTETTFADAQVREESSDYMLVGQTHPGATFFVDRAAPDMSVEPLTTYDPMVYPAPHGIKYVTRTEDGIVVADDNRIYISVPGQAMFYTEGIVNIDDKILAIEAIGKRILVLTDQYPVVVTYSITQGMLSVDRDTMQQPAPLTSKKSVSRYGTAVFFASTYTLMVWDTAGYGADLRSAMNAVALPDHWKLLEPETIVGTAYVYGYMLTSKRLKHSLMFEFAEGRIDTRANTHVMPISYINADIMGVDRDGHIVYTQEGSTWRWDYRHDEWCTDDFQDIGNRITCAECCPYHATFYYDNEGKNRFTVARIEFDELTAESVYAEISQSHFGNETPLATYDVLSSRGFGIPRSISAQAFFISVSGCATINEIKLATAYAELANRSTLAQRSEEDNA